MVFIVWKTLDGRLHHRELMNTRSSRASITIDWPTIKIDEDRCLVVEVVESSFYDVVHGMIRHTFRVPIDKLGLHECMCSCVESDTVR